jgi:hypothetical protein
MSHKKSKTPKSLTESASYNPAAPLFDTSSSDDESKKLKSSRRKRGSPTKQTLPEAYESIPRKNTADDTNNSGNKHDEFLNHKVRIIHGRYSGLVGRISRTVATGWIYIKDNDKISQPVRWGDIRLLEEDGGEEDESAVDETVEMEESEEEESDVDAPESNVVPGRNWSRCKKCKVVNCDKYRQGRCQGFCHHHYTYYKQGVTQEVVEDKASEGVEESDVDPQESKVDPGRDWSKCKVKKCKVVNCDKYRQGRCQGFCHIHYTYYKQGVTLEIVEDKASEGVKESDVDPQESKVDPGRDWSKCKVVNCDKYRQEKCQGFCDHHYVYYKRGVTLDIIKDTEDDKPIKKPKYNVTCDEYRQPNHRGYSKTHHRTEDPLHLEHEELKEMPNDEQEPSLIGAKIRIIDPNHSNLIGTILEKRSGIYLKIKWSHHSYPPPKMLPLEDVRICSTTLPFTNPKMKYMGCTVEKNGVEGHVAKVILGEWYITDIEEIQKAFKRNEFQVLEYSHDELEVRRGGDGEEMKSNLDGNEEESSEGKKGHAVDCCPFVAEKEEEESSTNPLLGTTVYIKAGTLYSPYSKAHIGKITEVCKRGWFVIEGLQKKIRIKTEAQAKSVFFVDDGNLDVEAIREYFDVDKANMPPVISLEKKKKFEFDDKKMDFDKLDSTEVERHNYSDEDQSNHCDEENNVQRMRAKQNHERYNSALSDNVDKKNVFKHKIALADFGGLFHAKSKGHQEEKEQARQMGAESIGGSGKHHKASLEVPNTPELNMNKRSGHHVRSRGSNMPVLDPILVQSSSSHYGREADVALQLLPEDLRQLSPDTMIEIFNRRTGKIMRGDEAIALLDLPAALMNHAEYEPIVPSHVKK